MNPLRRMSYVNSDYSFHFSLIGVPRITVEGIRWRELGARAVDVICHNVAGCQCLYPGQPWDWAVQLGDWLAESGDREGALAAYRQALEWKPGDGGIAAKIRALEDRQE